MLYINDQLYDFPLDEALDQLSPQRREQAMKYKHEFGQRASAAAYLLLCQGLREEYGIEEKPVFVYGEHGKPSLADYPHIHFSLSHCREAAACLVSDRPVGVDIETIRPLRPSLVEYTMNADEIGQIRNSDNPDLLFTRLWTQKEALAKCLGRGIDAHIRDLLTLHPEADLRTVVGPDHRYIVSECQLADSNYEP